MAAPQSIIARGIGFSPGNIRYVVTHGFDSTQRLSDADWISSPTRTFEAPCGERDPIPSTLAIYVPQADVDGIPQPSLPYADGDITACSACAESVGSVVFDGRFRQWNDSCLYQPKFPGEDRVHIIDGKQVLFFNSIRVYRSPDHLADVDPAHCPQNLGVWVLYISCFIKTSCAYTDFNPAIPQVIWRGHLPGLSPIGIYRWVQGCERDYQELELR